MKLGIEVLLEDKKLQKMLSRKKIGLVCHPASVDSKMNHSMDLLVRKLNLTCAFGPQHGIKGDKQYNMIESENEVDPVYKIPVFSLYGEVRRPTEEMMKYFDAVLFDLQDLGCRIYTFETTLLYMMQECAKHNKEIWVLDRPNPAGRDIEGFALEQGWESFVGAAPIPMRHGLTLGELALYYRDFYQIDVDLRVVRMRGYSFSKKEQYGWPSDRAWVNPSPNAATLNMARCYSGTVLLEGTFLSEGRGTTRPLEVMGHPEMDFEKILEVAQKRAPKWFLGAFYRPMFFEPTFYKHQGKLCSAVMIHTDSGQYSPAKFKPFRAVSLMLKVAQELHSKVEIFRDFPYEYVFDKLAFDVINGGPKLRQWIEDPKATPADLEKELIKDEKSWLKLRKKYLLYK
jgi:uncharacterized protein YbbC (DUF1343 family)